VKCSAGVSRRSLACPGPRRRAQVPPRLPRAAASSRGSRSHRARVLDAHVEQPLKDGI
jgi:hypothetical protein